MGTLTWCSVRKTTFFCEKLVSESNTKNMPIFCNYGEVEVAAQETGQFKLSKIKLDGESPRKWYRSSLFPSQRIYLVYRGLLAAYFVAWFVSQVVFKQIAGDNPKHFIYLTTWAETTLNLHLIASFLTCLYGYIYEYNDESSSSTPLSSEVNFGAESNAVLLPAGQVRHQGELRWFHKLSWALYTFSLDVGMSVTIAFWAILRTEFDAFSWHCHAINSVALIMDLIVSGTVWSRLWSVGTASLETYIGNIPVWRHVLSLETCIGKKDIGNIWKRLEISGIDWKHGLTLEITCSFRTEIMFPIRRFCFQSICDVSNIQSILQNDFLCFRCMISNSNNVSKLDFLYFQYSRGAGLETSKFYWKQKVISKHSFDIGNIIHRLETYISQYDFQSQTFFSKLCF